MSKGKHTEAEMIGALKQMEAGRRAEDVAREVGLSRHTLYAWKAKYGGLEVSEAVRLRQLEDENAAEEASGGPVVGQGNAAGGDPKKRLALVDRRADGGWLREQYAVSERRVCGLLLMAVSSFRYRSEDRDEALRTGLLELAREKPRYGYRRLHVLLRWRGVEVNHKRVYRIYRQTGLALRRKKRKHCVRISQPMREHWAANREWALDFVRDVLASGRAIRVLSVVDAFTRECLALEVISVSYE